MIGVPVPNFAQVLRISAIRLQKDYFLMGDSSKMLLDMSTLLFWELFALWSFFVLWITMRGSPVLAEQRFSSDVLEELRRRAHDVNLRKVKSRSDIYKNVSHGPFNTGESHKFKL